MVRSRVKKRTMPPLRRAMLAPLLLAACTGSVGSSATAPGENLGPRGGAPGNEGKRPDEPETPTARTNVASWGGVRQLSPVEYDNTLRSLLGDDSGAGVSKLPEPAAGVELAFSNDFPSKGATDVFVSSAETLAFEAAARAVNNASVRANILRCSPTGPGDAACLRSFIAGFGRRALRRPLAATEVDAYAQLGRFAVEKNNFLEGVRLVIAALLQQTDFLHRVELGTPIAEHPGLFRLNDFEVATRLSYFLLGTTPDDSLLDLAEKGELSRPDDIAAAARQLLRRPEARARVFQFHAEWLGINEITHALAAPMLKEARQLIERVIFEDKAAWSELFVADKTFVDAQLAAHYGLAAPASPTWVAWGNTGRAGLLSTGAFLSAFAKPEDTSPVNRGLYIATRLLCRHVPEPPADVNVSELPGTNCRQEMFAEHLERGASCFSCHVHMDNIGFGLENYDRTGRHRSHEQGRPACRIEGKGEVEDLGAFSGPAELSRLLVDAPEFSTCFVNHLHQFAVGHTVQSADDELLIGDFAAAFAARDRNFLELLVAITEHPSFAMRRSTPTPAP